MDEWKYASQISLLSKEETEKWEKFCARASAAAFLYDQRECEWWPLGWLDELLA
jgi:hypothetical protein